jgi:hypothetical protein
MKFCAVVVKSRICGPSPAGPNFGHASIAFTGVE